MRMVPTTQWRSVLADPHLKIRAPAATILPHAGNIATAFAPRTCKRTVSDRRHSQTHLTDSTCLRKEMSSTHNERPRRGAHSATGSFSFSTCHPFGLSGCSGCHDERGIAIMTITQRVPCRRLRSLLRAPCRGFRGSRRIRRTPCRCFRCRTGGRRTSCSWSSP